MARLVAINRVSKAARFPRAAVSTVLSRATRLWPQKIKDKKVAVALVDRSQSRSLNRAYRRKNKPTNVLSFASDSTGELGDIVICYDIASQEATSTGEKTAKRITYLFTHGLLHLLGFDHQNKNQEARMEQAARKLLNIKAR